MKNTFEAYPPKKTAEKANIFLLYKKAFPKSERKPFGMILRSHRQGKTDIIYCKEGKKFIGFATVMKTEQAVLLDYLAVAKKYRSKGYGSLILAALKEKYCGKGIIVEIEDPFCAGEDEAERKRRMEFYLRGGFFKTGIMARLFGVDMEILCTDSTLTEARLIDVYHRHYGALTEKFIKISKQEKATAG